MRRRVLLVVNRVRLWVWAPAVVVASVAAPVAGAAVAGRYTGRTDQGKSISLSLSSTSLGFAGPGGTVQGITLKLIDTCPDGRLLNVNIGSQYFPGLAVDKSGRFSGVIHPPSSPDQPTMVQGRFSGRQATGSISDTTISASERAYCYGITTFTVSLPGSPRPQACGSMRLVRITGRIDATGISCHGARIVFRAVEQARLPPDVAATPNAHWSRPYNANTPYGRYSCRREPRRLGGSEHAIRCSRGSAHVNWTTVHN